MLQCLQNSKSPETENVYDTKWLTGGLESRVQKLSSDIPFFLLKDFLLEHHIK